MRPVQLPRPARGGMVRRMPAALLIPLWAALLAAAAPLLAMVGERWGGLAPCALCLWQRWPYWVAAAIALAAALLPARARRWALRLAAVAVLASGAVAALHLGVEWGWWPSPLPGCQAPAAGGASVEELMRSLAPAPNKPCDEPAYLIPGLPLSMAAMNLLYALGLAALIAWLAGRGPHANGHPR
jgi:disulfide bond formation protein DsbB